jgi:glycosyltransferase involved in cell wall biosynthesis
MDHLPQIQRQPPVDHHWRLIQACRLIPKKGILTTLRALATLIPDFPNLRYILCGDGPQTPEILQLAAQLGITANLELKGWQKPAELLTEYHRAHLFLHPSELTADEDQEGIPNSMLEAMATGLPIVATTHGGIPEAVTHGKDGLLAAEKDPQSLADAIRSLLTNPTLLQQMGNEAAASVRQNFGSQNQINTLEDHYLEAIAIAQAETKPA